MHSALHILQTIYGYERFRAPQAEIIETVLMGGDVLALMPTGGGKSLCYQIPALLLKGVGIVVSPLIALMQDQVSALKQLGVKAAFLNSTLNLAEVMKIEQQLKDQTLDLLYIAPERLLTERTLSLLDQIPLALFAIDEAHCVSQWGHDFRPEYQQLSRLIARYPHVPRIALTATADPRTRQEIIEQLQLHKARVFAPSFDRPNIYYALNEQPKAKQALWEFIKTNHPQDAGIVYCLSRNKVDSIAQWLNAQGRTALPYHAGLSAEVRQANQERFLREDGIVMVATIAFGMGIDKPDVRFVAHLNLPKSIEAYYQETGRAGRDGQAANAWLAYGLQDVITLRQMLAESTASDQHKRVEHYKLDAMLALCELTTCRRQSILHYLGEMGALPCGNCDNCLTPPQTWNATTAAQKALSCVYRTGQRFGVNYLIEVLLGKHSERMTQFGHDKVSTFGIGKEHSEIEWRGIYRQLIALGYLSLDLDGFGGLQLTALARPLLKGEAELNLRRARPKTEEPEREKRTKTTIAFADQALWEALRNLRMKLAQAQGVPPYAIFHDATLMNVVQERPTTLAALRRIHGIGQHKFEHYGGLLLEAVLAHPRNVLLSNNLSDTINKTLELYSTGKTPEQIAQERQLKLETIYNHFAAAIEAGLMDIQAILPLSKAEYHQIATTFELMSEQGKALLKPVYEALDGQYDYGVLACVRASLGRV